MKDPDQFAFEGDDSSRDRPVSVYRAFFYSAGLPGAGEWYAGRRLAGALTCGAALGLLAAFTVYSVIAVGDLMQHAETGLQTGRLALERSIPILAAGASLFGFYLAWLWGMTAAVEAAAARRRADGLPIQRSAAWGAFMSWVCPGCGQVFTGKSLYGYAILAGYVTAGVFVALAYKQLAASLLDMLRQGSLEPLSRLEALRLVQAKLLILDHGFAQWLRRAVAGLAVAETALALSPSWVDDCAPPGSGPAPWHRTRPARAAGLLGLGWLCPGAGQILQGRPSIGWIFFVAWFAVQALLGILLWNGGADTPLPASCPGPEPCSFWPP